MIRLFRRRLDPPVRLETKRFVLKSLTRRELARASFPWTNDPEVMHSLELTPGGWTQRAWERHVIKPNNRDKFGFGIEERQSGSIIGYELVQVSRAKIALLGVVVGDHEWWGRGVVAETRSTVLDFVFNELECARAWGIVFARNFPSISNYLTLGFQHEGTLRGHYLAPGGGHGDAMVFGMLREEWAERRNAGASHERSA